MNTYNDKKRLLSNFFSLASLQGVNYILPLLTFPYLVRVLGVEYFGLLAFATAVVAYFNIITDYGFNLTATREISIHRNDHKKVIEIFSSVMSIKLFLMFLSLIILTILVFFFEKLSNHWEIYFLTFGTVVGQVLFPVWFFQGMERMKYITYLNIVAKVIFTVAIFVFVKEQNDFYLVPLFTSLGFIVVGLWSLWIIYKEFGIGFRLQPLDTLKYYLLDGWDLFKAQFLVNFYRSGNLLILGVLTNNTLLGYYAVADKIIMAVSGFFIPANQAIYPFMAKLYHRSRNDFMVMLKKVSFVYLSTSLLIFILMFHFGGEIVKVVNGSESEEILLLYSILLLSIFTTPFSTLYGQVLVTQNQNKKISEVVGQVTIINMIIVPVSIIFGSTLGMAITVVGLQYFIIVRYYMIIYYPKSRNKDLG